MLHTVAFLTTFLTMVKQKMNCRFTVGLSFKGEKFTSVDDIKVGDVVVVYGSLRSLVLLMSLIKTTFSSSLNGTTTGITNITADEAARTLLSTTSQARR